MNPSAGRFATLFSIFFVLAVGCGWWLNAAAVPPATARANAQKAYNAGNYKDAYEAYRRLALDPQEDEREAPGELTMALQCLRNLGRVDEIDALREAIIEAHPKNWRLLASASESFFGGENYGFLIAGKFQRGQHRGGGQLVNADQRDRTRALQLMMQALPLAQKDDNKGEAADFFMTFSRVLLSNRGFSEAWRLQYLTDLATLPDYEEGWFYGHSGAGAPVGEDGQPIYYRAPRTLEAAVNDGERWRWCLAQAVEMSASKLNESRKQLADFLHDQFGVQTMAQHGGFFGRGPLGDNDAEDEKKNESGTYALHTLEETETIARLASGIKRFALPDEFNYVRLYQQIADNPKTGYAEESLNTLAQIFENRRQYEKAADYWRRSIKEYGRGANNYKSLQLEQIVGVWGRFEPISTQPAGKGPTIEYRFRNGKRVRLEAQAIKVDKLLEDVKAYLKTRPTQLDWQRLNLADLGYRLIQQNQSQYIGEKVANWELALDPREHHFDKRITVATPLQKAGAYLLTATIDGGNTSKIVLWVADTALIKKPLADKAFYFVADAVTGQPIAKANLEFFGYQQKHIRNNQYQIDTLNFADFSDDEGRVLTTKKEQPSDNYQWIVTARTKSGRLAYLGFSNVWYSNYYDQQYNEKKVYVITDRPVYRPKQPVKFKFWVQNAKYDQETSDFAGQPFAVEVQNPKGEKAYAQQFKADDYGGFEGQFELPADATLGVYQLHIPGHGGGTFRVEEYKKPEFEVTVDAPKEPVMLGEKVTGVIKAKYYFGAPVVKAKVKYKVTRNSYSQSWYPIGLWDWLYGPGYWWFSYDYRWYPGWLEWGCKRPSPWWWPGFGQQQPPELVADREVEIGADGTIKVEIDTAVAKAIHPDQDHEYKITAEVVDESRRTIVGAGTVLVARQPFKVFTWVDRGYYRVGDAIHAGFSAQTLDQKPVAGTGKVKLLAISYGKDDKPVEEVVREWDLDTNEQGRADLQIKASAAGQYRLSYTLTDGEKHTLEGGYLFTVIGDGFDGAEFRYNDVELIPDKREYEAGDKVKLQINTNRARSTVLLFVRPANGVYLPPKILHLKGKSTIEDIEIAKKDMPNFFVEAVTIADGKVFSETKEIVVPPEKRVLNVEVIPSAQNYKPGQKAQVQVRLTDFFGKPFVGSTVLAVYDKALEYIAGGSNVADIKVFFWKWRRTHYPQIESSLERLAYNLAPPGKPTMQNLGVFGENVTEEGAKNQRDEGKADRGADKDLRKGAAFPMAPAGGLGLAGRALEASDALMAGNAAPAEEQAGAAAAPPLVQPTVRSKFADTAYWAAALTTDDQGLAKISLDMPENLTTWKIKAWGLGHGAKVGQGEAEVITRKDLIVRLQAPRFLIQKDEVVLSANVHNYLDQKKTVTVVNETTSKLLLPLGEAGMVDKDGTVSIERKVEVPAGGEARVDFRVSAIEEGEALIRMKALTDTESDAMEMRIPVFVHGMLKIESFSGDIRPDKESSQITVRVAAERRISQTRLELRYSPSLAGALVDALPYLVDYPYDSTDQTLSRFLPTVIVQKILLDLGVDLKAVQEKRTNLNAQEIGDDATRAKGWKRFDRNPVFDRDEVNNMVKVGVQRLTEMQLSDGGWGWFFGWGEHSSAHMTAYVVHGLQIAAQNDVALVPGTLERGVDWLKKHQDEQIQRLKNAKTKTRAWKEHTDELDAFVYMALVDAGVKNQDMLDFLDRDRTHLAVYAKAMFGLALHKQGEKAKLAEVMRNISQYVVQDDENQTAYLKLPENNYLWFWYGSEIEADSYYLKLLVRDNPQSEVAPRLVKYLLNNRKHATYWNSTRDTAVAIEALAEYFKASGENKPDLAVEIWLDGKLRRETKITTENLFAYDNKFVLEGDAVESGEHKIEFKKKGRGPLYFNAYLTNFTLEDDIKHAGLEIKVNRKYYQLTKVDKSVKVAGSRGQAVDQKVEKYQRNELKNLATLKSGDLVEIELEIDSKNDYEYLMFEDMKAAGFEPVDLRSGYNSNSLGAYMELRDNRVVFFARSVARGKHSVSYRMRAETPGMFSALPTVGAGVYAPELKANSDEIKLRIED